MFQLLFGWVARSFVNRRRAIFRYWDGRQFRRIDPIAALIAIKELPGFDLATHLSLAIDLEDPEGLRLCQDAAQRVFGVQPFDGERGLTVAEAVGLLGSFTLYLSEVKKKAEPLLTSPPSTEPPPSDASTMKPESASGSTASGSDCSEPPKSPAASATLSPAAPPPSSSTL